MERVRIFLATLVSLMCILFSTTAAMAESPTAPTFDAGQCPTQAALEAEKASLQTQVNNLSGSLKASTENVDKLMKQIEGLNARLAVCEGTPVAAPDATTPEAPKPRPWSHKCDESTNDGHGGITNLRGSMDGHCTCPPNTRLVTGKLDSRGVIETCVYTQQYIDYLLALKADGQVDAEQMAEAIKQLQDDQGQLANDVNVLVIEVKYHRDMIDWMRDQLSDFDRRINALEKRVDKLETETRKSLQFTLGPTAMAGMNGSNTAGALGLAGSMRGWFGETVGLFIEGRGTVEFVQNQDYSFGASVAAGPAFRLNDSLRLYTGGMYSQLNRAENEGDGLNGHFLGAVYGAHVALDIKPWDFPMAIQPFAEVGYGVLNLKNADGVWEEGDGTAFRVGVSLPFEVGVDLKK